MSFKPRGNYYLFLEPAAASGSGYRLEGMAEGPYRAYRLPQTSEEKVISFLGGRFDGQGGRSSGALPLAPTFSLTNSNGRFQLHSRPPFHSGQNFDPGDCPKYRETGRL